MLICRFYRFWMAVRGGPPDLLPAIFARHVRSCASCRQAWIMEQAVADRLVQEASQSGPEAPPFLATRIQAAIRTEAASKVPPIGRGRTVWAMAGVASVAALLIAAAVWRYGGPGPAGGGGGSLPAAEATTTWRLASNLLPTQDQLLAAGRQLDQPLDEELGRMMRDARHVAAVLAESFLPDATME